jgi:hypothetical protein
LRGLCGAGGFGAGLLGARLDQRDGFIERDLFRFLLSGMVALMPLLLT